MLYVIGRSTADGTRAGVISSLGIATGTLVHLAAVVLGLATLLETVPLAYDIVRFAGAAYLVYLGVRALASAGGTTTESAVTPASDFRVFRQGVITNVLNPKVALFFAAFLPQFASPENGPVVPQLIILGLLFNCSGTTVNVLVAYVTGRARERVKSSITTAGWLRKLTGAVFIGLGVRLVLQRR